MGVAELKWCAMDSNGLSAAKKFNINESEKAKEDKNSKIKMGKDDNSDQSGLQVIIHPGTDEETLKKDSTESIPIPKINATNDNTTSEYFIDFFFETKKLHKCFVILPAL